MAPPPLQAAKNSRSKAKVEPGREGLKINAVKRVREATGLGLKEALDLVERLPL